MNFNNLSFLPKCGHPRPLGRPGGGLCLLVEAPHLWPPSLHCTMMVMLPLGLM